MLLKDKNLYYVGGVVRDEILGVKSFDTDYCYEGNAIEFSKNFHVIKKNPNFGTVRILLDGEEIDIASTREEIYPVVGHLPKVTRIGCSLKDDLKRRDFTINALAKNTLDGNITDFFNGLSDIKEKKLRVLHDKSFVEDPSRIIRGLKFSVRFGFNLEEKTLFLQNEYLENINYDMSYHRIKKELKETFNLNKSEIFKKFIEQGIYKLLGENQQIPTLQASAKRFIDEFDSNNKWVVYLGLFDLKNFELTADENKIICGYNNIKSACPAGELEIYKLFHNVPKESVMLYGIGVDFDIAYNYLKNLREVKILTTGDDLKRLGIPIGKIYKEVFDFLLAEKFKNKNLTLEDELNLVREKYV